MRANITLCKMKHIFRLLINKKKTPNCLECSLKFEKEDFQV